MTQSEQQLTHFYTQVMSNGQLLSEPLAQRWTRAVLQTLGTTLRRSTKKQLAQALPQELADYLTDVFWLLHFRNTGMTNVEFQYRVSMRAGNTDKYFARIPTRAVFHEVRQLVSESVASRVADDLSPDVRKMWLEA